MRRLLLLVCALVVVSGTSFADDLDQQIQQKKVEIQAAETSLQPLLAPVVVAGADLRAWLSARIFNLVTATYNQQANHTFHYQATSEQGNLATSSGGALGCGWDVRVHNGNAVTADMTVNNLSGQWSSSGSEAIGMNYAFQANAQLDGHVNGPAGPCSIWHLQPTCNCQIGGGFGSSVGTSANKGGNFAGAIQFTSSGGSWLSYAVLLTYPPSIPITVSFSLQYIGSVGVPVTIPVSNGVVTSGSVASLFTGDGEVKVGNPPILDKKYSITVTPLGSAADAAGYAGTANVTIAIH